MVTPGSAESGQSGGGRGSATAHEEVAYLGPGGGAAFLVETFDEQDPVQVVEFVLEEATGELGGLEGDLVTVEVTTDHVDMVGPGDLPAQTGHRQAGLLVDPFTLGFDDLGIDDRLTAPAVVEIPDEDLFLDADLGCREAEARGGVHRVEHGLGQGRDPPVDVVDRGGGLSEDRIADHPDVVGGHGAEATVAVVSAPTPERQPGHYFDPDPVVASHRREIEIVLPEGRSLVFVTDRGTFSSDRLDPGTRVLLIEAPEPTGTVLVDLGCGWGPIAVTMALRNPTATVWAVDPNERARVLCAENAERNGVGDRVRVVSPDEVPDDLRVDTIWSNPPIRIGKAALDRLLGSWLDRLRPDGVARLVVNRNLGADSLARRLAATWSVERLASTGGYRVLSVTRPEEGP